MHPLNRNDGKLLTTKLQCSRLRIVSPRFSFFLSIFASTGSSAFRLLGWRFLEGILLNSKRLYRSVSLRRMPSNGLVQMADYARAEMAGDFEYFDRRPK